MPLYETAERKQCAKCKLIKDKEKDFGNTSDKSGGLKKHNKCNPCRQKNEEATQVKKEEKRKLHWMDKLEKES